MGVKAMDFEIAVGRCWDDPNAWYWRIVVEGGETFADGYGDSPEDAHGRALAVVRDELPRW